ncbi:MAG TPA: hypothetical protein VMG59_07510 [Phycisphaerae bacterium]|nr:hypothetical protein [Phycisphaerae bacterium]
MNKIAGAIILLGAAVVIGIGELNRPEDPFFLAESLVLMALGVFYLVKKDK